MRLLIVTDAWRPQVNGVVSTLERTGAELRARGHTVEYLTPEGFRSIAAPTYPEIRLALFAGRAVRQRIAEGDWDAIHVATEGPLGHAARAACRDLRLAFTSSYHTQFPEYLRLRCPIPLAWSYAWLRRFHGLATRTMVATRSVREALRARGFTNLAAWTRGVDTALFQPGPKDLLDLPRPLSVYAGRVALEKNIAAFLDTPLPGAKLVVGGGPDLARLRARYPAVHFTGYKFGTELAALIAAGDVFVFPSRTDTFGLVMLEALACGVPVAAYPVTGPVDVIEDGITGALDEDLGRAVERALTIPPARCRAAALRMSWGASAAQFVGNLVPCR